MWESKKVKQLRRELSVERQLREQNTERLRKLDQLADSVYVAKELASLLGIYDNYRGKFVSWGYSYDELNVDLLAKDLRAETEAVARSVRLAPLKVTKRK